MYSRSRKGRPTLVSNKQHILYQILADETEVKRDVSLKQSTIYPTPYQSDTLTRTQM